MINSMRRAIVLDVLPPLPAGAEANDPNDTFLLAIALAGDADYLVTGDRRAGLLQRGSIGRAQIELEVLAILTERYEKEAFPIDPPAVLDVISFRMEQAAPAVGD